MTLADVINAIWDAGRHVPDTVWAAIVASAITLFGVWLANKNSRAQLRMQLEANKEEAARARLFEMRRAVHLDGAEVIARANATVGRMGEVELSNAEISQTMVDTFARLAKILVVSEIETVRAMTAYQVTLTQCMAALWPKRFELLHRARILKDLEEGIKAAVTDRDRWIEQIRLAHVQGVPESQPIWARLQAGVEIAERGRAELAEKHRELSSVQARELLAFVEVCLNQAAPLRQVLPALLTRARVEFGLAGDEATFREITNAASEKTEAAARELARKAREMAGQAATGKKPGSGPEAA